LPLSSVWSLSFSSFSSPPLPKALFEGTTSPPNELNRSLPLN
jgi:hypothetical protein